MPTYRELIAQLKTELRAAVRSYQSSQSAPISPRRSRAINLFEEIWRETEDALKLHQKTRALCKRLTTGWLGRSELRDLIIAALERENFSIEAFASCLIRDNQLLKGQLQQLEQFAPNGENAEAWRQHIEQMIKKNAQLTRDNNRLYQENSLLKERIAKIEEVNKRLAEQVQDLYFQLDQLKQQVTVKDKSEMPRSASPTHSLFGNYQSVATISSSRT